MNICNQPECVVTLQRSLPVFANLKCFAQSFQKAETKSDWKENGCEKHL